MFAIATCPRYRRGCPGALVDEVAGPPSGLEGRCRLFAALYELIGDHPGKICVVEAPCSVSTGRARSSVSGRRSDLETAAARANATPVASGLAWEPAIEALGAEPPPVPPPASPVVEAASTSSRRTAIPSPASHRRRRLTEPVPNADLLPPSGRVGGTRFRGVHGRLDECSLGVCHHGSIATTNVGGLRSCPDDRFSFHRPDGGDDPRSGRGRPPGR